MLSFLKESFFVFVAIGFGSFAFKKLDKFWRIAYLQIWFYMLFLIAAYLVTYYQNLGGQALNNQVVYNIAVLFECSLLLLMAYVYFQNKRNRFLVLIAYIIFLLIYFYQIIIGSIFKFFNQAYIVACLMVSLTFGLILFHHFKFNNLKWSKNPLFIMIIGLLIYFACSVPFMNVMHYLNIKSVFLSKFLFNYLIDILSAFRYFMLGYAFWLIYKSDKVAVIE